MNLINEQSVTSTATTTTSSTNEAKELSPAQARRRRAVRSSLESASSTAVGITPATSSSSPSLSLSLSFSSTTSTLPLSPLTFASFVRAPALSSSLPESALVEPINRQIEKIPNKIRSSDAYQSNLIKKMPTTTKTTAPLALSLPLPLPLAAAATTAAVNIDSVSDVSDCTKNNKNGDNSATPPSVPATEKERKIGCEHYKRRAMFVTPCCNKFYKCRYCHDENETHHFDRKTLTELICVECNTRQKVQEQCEKCGVRFGKYTCLICNLFDDEDKNQYHCDGCGICRIGGRVNFFHCEVCNMCLPIELKIQGHRCVENISRSNCPVCLGAIHTSRIPCHIPDCGHLLHKMCFDQLLASGHYVCPTCQTSLLDMTKMWEYLDAQALLMAVPKKYDNQRVYIFCNDCHETCKTKFHFVGLKCIHCGGYNTTQDVKRRMSWANGADSSTSA